MYPGSSLTPVRLSTCSWLLQAFTRAVTVPSCGYSSLQESWEASDGLRWIPRITTPTLMVSAKDDPFLDPQ